MKISRSLLFTAIALSFAFSSSLASEPFWLGADISGTTFLESQNIYSYNSAGVKTENTQLMKDLGLNAVRLRVWVNPKGGWSSKEDVLTMAKRAHKLGMAIMIDFHYSDWWADPGKQNIPEAWKNLSYEEMKEALAQHTRETLSLLKDNGIDVQWVQVGNETTNGFLWPMGNLHENMEQYAGLTTAGYDAVKEIYPNAQVIVHLDNGFDNDLYNYVFDGLKKHGGKWDIIGMSVYPYWAIKGGHEPDAASTLEDTLENIRLVSAKYGCDVIITETGVEASRPEEGKAFIADLIHGARYDTNSRCKGVFYWAPEEGDRGYSLGAFHNNRPTIIMDAFTEASLEQ